MSPLTSKDWQIKLTEFEQQLNGLLRTKQKLSEDNFTHIRKEKEQEKIIKACAFQMTVFNAMIENGHEKSFTSLPRHHTHAITNLRSVHVRYGRII